MLKGFCKLYRAWDYYLTLLNKVLYTFVIKQSISFLNLMLKLKKKEQQDVAQLGRH